jgi:hypothetical protein
MLKRGHFLMDALPGPGPIAIMSYYSDTLVRVLQRNRKYPIGSGWGKEVITEEGNFSEAGKIDFSEQFHANLRGETVHS